MLFAIVKANRGLRMRTSDSINSKKILTIPNNSIIELVPVSKGGTGKYKKINGIPGNWRKIKYKNNIGWVFGGFLELPENEYANMIKLYKRKDALYTLKNLDRDYAIEFYDDNNEFYGTLYYQSSDKTLYLDSGGPDASNLLDMIQINKNIIIYSNHTYCIEHGESKEGIPPCLKDKTDYYKSILNKQTILFIIKGSLRRIQIKGRKIINYRKQK